LKSDGIRELSVFIYRGLIQGPTYFREMQMILCLVSQEKNLGILTLTDFLIKEIGKPGITVYGWNYLIQDSVELIERIKQDSTNRTVLVKYVIPKIRFSNQGSSFPRELEEISDIMFKVPSYREELSPQVPLVFLKGENHPIVKYIKKFYA